jgi:hypothetical protein
MVTRKTFVAIALAIGLVGIALLGYGCKKSGQGTASAAETVELCTMCGQIKGSDLCCKPDQTKCADCGLVKGSPGCCAIPEGAEKAAICTKCGQIAGTELCCKPDQTTCAGCGLVKDSPGCCKIPKQQS